MTYPVPPKPGPKLKVLIQITNYLESLIDAAIPREVSFESVLDGFFEKHPLDYLSPDEAKFICDRLENTARIKHERADRIKDSADSLILASARVFDHLQERLKAAPDGRMEGETWTAQLQTLTVIESVDFEVLQKEAPEMVKVKPLLIPQKIRDALDADQAIPGVQTVKESRMEFVVNKKRAQA